MSNIKRAVVVKVDATTFVKYRNVNSLPRFVTFLRSKFPGWRYMNVFSKETGKQVANFTNKNPPTSHV